MSAVRGLEKVARDRRHLLAAQVRCSTGFTQGRVVEGAAKLPVLPPITPGEAQRLRTREPAWWLKVGAR